MAGTSPILEPQQRRSIETRQRLLDAAVDELLENGYAGVTTVSVARRAQVTRGAQQHHFPGREALVAQAVRHLARRQSDELSGQIAALPRGKSRVSNGLDLVYTQFGGPLFAAVFELSLAARHDPVLRGLVREEEQAMSKTVLDLGREILGEELMGTTDFAARWTLALSTIRGVAMLGLLGHSERLLQRQWRFARTQIIASLTA